jgi:hypothetical protein
MAAPQPAEPGGNDFDRAARYAVKGAAAATFHWVFPGLTRTHPFKRWLDSQSAPRPGEPDRRCDTIAELVDDEGASPPWAAVLELFAGPDADAIDRTLEYLGRFRRELLHSPHGHDRYPFTAALVFLTEAPGTKALDMMPPGEVGLSLVFRPRVLVLPDEDAVALLKAIEDNPELSGLLAWPPLMKGGERDEVIAAWRALAEQVPEERRRTLGTVALIFADLAGRKPEWQKGLEGMGVNESSVLREVRQAEAVKNYRDILLRWLRLRAKGELSPVLRKRVEAQNNLTELSRWVDLAMEAESIEAFEANISR